MVAPEWEKAKRAEEEEHNGLAVEHKSIDRTTYGTINTSLHSTHKETEDSICAER